MWIGYKILSLILLLFLQVEHGHFLAFIAIKVWVPCVHNSYSCVQIILKLYRCFGHGLKMCMWFGYIVLRLFILLLHKLDFVISQVLFLSKKKIESGY